VGARGGYPAVNSDIRRKKSAEGEGPKADGSIKMPRKGNLPDKGMIGESIIPHSPFLWWLIVMAAPKENSSKRGTREKGSPQPQIPKKKNLGRKSGTEGRGGMAWTRKLIFCVGAVSKPQREWQEKSIRISARPCKERIKGNWEKD